MKIADVTVKKVLGYGMIGTVNLATDDAGNKYALKIQHILKKDVLKSLASYVWREIEFAKTMNIYPDQFMTLYDYEISTCDHKQKYAMDLKIFDEKTQKKFAKLAASPICVKMLYAYKGQTIQQLLERKISLKLRCSLAAQIIGIADLLKHHGYRHGDMHFGNMTVTKTDKKYVTLSNIRIPTYGYMVSVIDYDSVLHKKYIMTSHEKHMLADPDYNEAMTIIEILMKNPMWKYIRDKKIRITPYDKVIELFKKTPEYVILSRATDRLNSQLGICEIMFPSVHQKLVLGDKYRGKAFEITYNIPQKSVIYLILNSQDYPGMIKHLLAL
jgi:serine/threonine protein kinase